jgi:hypothetical protein
MQKIFKLLLAQLIVLFLVGCGGSGNGSDQSGNTEGQGGGKDPSGNSAPSFTSDCSENYCGSNANTYTGIGIGAWHYKNNSDKNVALNVSLSNVTDKNITIVFTNEGSNKVQLPHITVNTALKSKMNVKNAGYIDTFNYIPDNIKKFNFKDLTLQKSKSYQNTNYQIAANTWGVNDQKHWYVSKEQRIATLKKQETISGLTVNIWLENSEYGDKKITDATIDKISSRLDDVVRNVVSIAGEPWGTHQYSNLIPSNQPLNIVLANFNQDGQGFGTIGYFYPLNNFINDSASIKDSNEALAIFVDTETIYDNRTDDGILYGISTIAHELTHAVHFYKRLVVTGEGFDTFLNEMTAIMMEDIVAQDIDSTFNNVKLRYVQWHKDTLYGHNFADWITDDDSDDSYDIAGSFGAFLLRQHGVNFYKTLFTARSDLSASNKSLNILDKAIKEYNGEGLGRALQRWGASIAMLPANESPKGFGYPMRYDNNDFYFEGFDRNDYKKYRTLPEKSPETLEGYAHFPFLRKPIGNTYTEEFTVPSNVSVSIIVQ